MLLLFSSSLTFAFGDTFNVSIIIPFVEGVDTFDDLMDDLGDALIGNGVTKRSKMTLKKSFNIKGKKIYKKRWRKNLFLQN